jgi:hypothetical protein
MTAQTRYGGATDDARFCPLCGVSLDLHDGPDTCRSAGMKANLLERFDHMVGVR